MSDSSLVDSGFPARLKELRKEHNMSQRQLSSSGVSYAHISRMEAGDRIPSVLALIKLAGKLEVTALYLATGQDDNCPVCGRHKGVFYETVDD